MTDQIWAMATATNTVVDEHNDTTTLKMVVSESVENNKFDLYVLQEKGEISRTFMKWDYVYETDDDGTDRIDAYNEVLMHFIEYLSKESIHTNLLEIVHGTSQVTANYQ